MTAWIKDKAGEILHNCVAHPLMPFLPKAWGYGIHDWTLQFWPSYEGE